MDNKLSGVITAFLLALGSIVVIQGTTSLQTATAQEGMKTQKGVILGYGGMVFGIVNVASNGHSLKVSAVTDLVPYEDRVFEAWLVDGNYAASGYPLSLGQFVRDGSLSYNENLVNAYTFTDIAVTMEPRDDADPKPSWSNQVGVYLLSPPFGK
jgi:hypothetical protein